MPQPVQVLKPTFTGGEFAPSLWSRVDLQRYASGCRKLRNFFIHPHGGASNRPGLQFISKPRYPNKKCRGVGFEFSTEQVYSIEFGECYCRFYMNGGQIIAPTDTAAWITATVYYIGDFVKVNDVIYRSKTNHTSGAGNPTPPGNATDWEASEVYEIETPYLETDLPLLKFSQSADVLYITHPNHYPRTLTRYSHISWRLELYPFEDGPFMPQNTDDDFTLDVSGISGEDKTLTASTPVLLQDGSVSTGTNETLDNTWEAVKFTTSGAHKVRSFSIRIKVSASLTNPNAYISGFIYSDNAGVPGTLLGGTSFVRYGRLSTLYNEHKFLINLDLTASTAYWLVFKRSAAPTGGTIYLDSVNTGTALHAYSADGITWAAENNKTLWFKLYGKIAKALFQTTHIGALFKVMHEIPSQTVSGSWATTITGESEPIKCFGVWRLITHGTWNGKLRIEKSIDGGLIWTEVRAFSSEDDLNFNTYDSEDEDKPFLIRLACYQHSSSGGTIKYDLSSDPYTQAGIVKITDYVSESEVTVDILNEVGSIDPTADWAEGSWSDYRGYPAVSAFYQDRLGFASTKSESQTTWTTKTGNYINFGRGDPLVDSDGITVNLPSRKMNAIRHLIPLGEILAFTKSSEWSIGPGPNASITPTSVSQKLQGYRGCSEVTPVIIGNRVIFVQPKGSIVRDLVFDWGSDSYVGDPLSLLSNHLFQNHQIIDMAYQAEPDGLVWCVRDDGILLSLTYLREQEVVAWTWHDTDGEFESVWTIPGETYDEVWFVVKRGNERFIERLVQRMVSTDPRDQFFVDCGLTYDVPKTITNITKAAQAVVTVPANGDFENWLAGSELVLNGIVWMGATGTTPPDSWTNESAGADTYDIDSGTLKMTTVDANAAIQQIITLIPGVTYKLSVDLKNGNLGYGIRVHLGTSSHGTEYGLKIEAGTFWLTHTVIFTATQENCYVLVMASASGTGQYGWVDNCSVRPITPYFNDGDLVDISDVEGMTEVNNLRFKVSDRVADTFKLKDPNDDTYINSSAYAAYISGGKVRKAVTIIYGLNHIEGKTVAVLADGNVINNLVVANGTITLPVAASRVQVGLPYVSDLETLDIELSLVTGTTQGKLLKVSNVEFRFLNSRGGWIGPDSDHLDEITQRTDEPMGSPIDLKSGFYKQPITGNYSEGGRVFFRQKDPLPATILAVIPSLSIGG